MSNILGDKSFLYEGVSALIDQMVNDGTLGPGDRVPSLRKMSKQLDVSIATVSQAYLKLEETGLIYAKPQSGFYISPYPKPLNTPTHKTPSNKAHKVHLGDTICEVFSDARHPAVIGLGVANPGMHLLPCKALSRTLKRMVSEAPEKAINYAYPDGLPELRKQIALRAKQTGCRVSKDEVIITNGATEVMLIAIQAVAKPGDVVAITTPSYYTTLQMIERLGILLVEIENDVNTGISLSDLEKAIKHHKLKALITVANFSNPTGSLMPEENKKKLITILDDNDITLIEDDVYGEVYFTNQRPLPCKSYDTQNNAIYCSSFSKTLAPGYRVGWIISGKHQQEISYLKQLSSLSTPTMQQMTVADFLSKGHYDRHLISLRRQCQQQMAAMRHTICCYFPAGTRISQPKGGFTLWVQLPGRLNSFEIYSQAMAENINFAPGPLFSVTKKYKNCLRLCAAKEWTPAVKDALIRLAKIISEIHNNNR